MFKIVVSHDSKQTISVTFNLCLSLRFITLEIADTFYNSILIW